MKAYINPDSPQFFAFNIWDVASAKSVMDAAQIKQKLWNSICTHSCNSTKHKRINNTAE